MGRVNKEVGRLEVVKSIDYLEGCEDEYIDYTFKDSGTTYKITESNNGLGRFGYSLTVKNSLFEREFSDVELRMAHSEADLYSELMEAVYKRLLKYEPDFVLSPDILDEPH